MKKKHKCNCILKDRNPVYRSVKLLIPRCWLPPLSRFDDLHKHDFLTYSTFILSAAEVAKVIFSSIIFTFIFIININRSQYDLDLSIFPSNVWFSIHNNLTIYFCQKWNKNLLKLPIMLCRSQHIPG